MLLKDRGTASVKLRVDMIFLLLRSLANQTMSDATIDPDNQELMLLLLLLFDAVVERAVVVVVIHR
jgi:hypothetical protein